MLTKEHLKFRVRSGRIRPELIPVEDPENVNTARALIGALEDGVGSPLGDVEAAMDDAATGPLAQALKKLLLDACEMEEVGADVEERRWRTLFAAHHLRLGEPGLSLAQYQARLGALDGAGYDAVRSSLYGDLPACRRVLRAAKTTPEKLLARFNCAQVQGLLLRARRVSLRFPDMTLAMRRSIFRQIKFRRLIAEVVESGESLVISLSGPLGLLDQASAYGLRLALFFPSVLHCERWEIEAEVHINNKNLLLKLRQDCGLVSHYSDRSPYIPEEMTSFLQAFNERYHGAWQAEPGADFVHIGRESYCFPDFTVKDQDGRAVHFELFHRWHSGQLIGRLQALEKNPLTGLRVGVSRPLSRMKAVAEALDQSRWFAKFGFIFSEFPTPKTIATQLGSG